ncbi:lamin tail domain-containing protein [Streptomyces sp. NPDC051133]|uniref:lamin tail domain-containing protein n=1 Tax=Streptomyces sp. NPDC051133 TaxID=3155521 RepID=UPI003435A386
MTAVAAVAAAAVGAVALPAVAADHHPAPRSHHYDSVRISEVQTRSDWDRSDRDRSDRDRSDRDRSDRGHWGRDHSDRALDREWVALTNNSREAVNLDGWTLSDRDGHTYTFHHYRLAGRSSVRVHTGFGRDTRTDLFQDRRKSVWDRVDTASLRNDHGRLVDTASWGRRSHR